MNNEEYTKIIERLTSVEQSNKSAHKRIDGLEKLSNAFCSMAEDVKVLATEMIALKENVKEIKEKVEKQEDKPSKLVDGVKQVIINAIMLAIITAIMALILK